MPAIKPMAQIAEKWGRVTPARSQDYATGVRSPRVDWASAAAAAEDTYNAGVQEAIGRGAYGKGVSAAGTEKWKRKAMDVGERRFGEGVRAAVNDYSKGFAPFREVIEGTSLPPRGPKGDPRNIERVAILARALHARKVGG